jgi:hypothetical protein
MSFKQLLSCTHEAEWTPFQTHYSQNLEAPGIEPRLLVMWAETLTIRPQRLSENLSHTLYQLYANAAFPTVAGFSEALVVCVCFLTVIRVPTAMSAPASRRNSLELERINSHPKWINPCGIRTSDDFDSELDGVPRLNDNELLSSIIVSAKNTLMHAERFKENYVSFTLRGPVFVPYWYVHLQMSN